MRAKRGTNSRKPEISTGHDQLIMDEIVIESGWHGIHGRAINLAIAGEDVAQIVPFSCRNNDGQLLLGAQDGDRWMAQGWFGRLFAPTENETMRKVEAAWMT